MSTINKFKTLAEQDPRGDFAPYRVVVYLDGQPDVLRIGSEASHNGSRKPATGFDRPGDVDQALALLRGTLELLGYSIFEWGSDWHEPGCFGAERDGQQIRVEVWTNED